MSARVECFWCHQQVWKEETEYFNHDGVEGYQCEPCRAELKQECSMQYKRFLSLCDKYKTNPPKSNPPITFNL